MNTLLRAVISSVSVIVILILLHILGLVSISFAVILSFFMMLIGFIMYSWLFGSGRKVLLTAGAFLFFMGLLWFLQKLFHYTADTKEFLLALVLSGGFSSLMVFIEDISAKRFAIAAVLLISTGIVLLFHNTGFSFQDAAFWLIEIVKKVWVVFVILLVYFVILSRDKGREEE